MSLYEYTLPYTYLGCFVDDRGSRVLSGGFITDPDMTQQLCSTICEASNLHFGLEYGVECYCGLPSDDPDRLDPATCDYPCAGDTSETCGGFNAVSVYEYAVVDPVPPTYLGCWGDSREGRIMQSVQSDIGMTTDQCQAICSAHPYFGLQYGFECWCGDNTTDYEVYGPTVCGHACPGNADDICGGNFAMSVWEH